MKYRHATKYFKKPIGRCHSMRQRRCDRNARGTAFGDITHEPIRSVTLVRRSRNCRRVPQYAATTHKKRIVPKRRKEKIVPKRRKVKIVPKRRKEKIVPKRRKEKIVPKRRRIIERMYQKVNTNKLRGSD